MTWLIYKKHYLESEKISLIQVAYTLDKLNLLFTIPVKNLRLS